MASRRQQKIARVIRESVSFTILNRLSDPRITGLVSVTEVDVAPDMKNATVYLSILAPDQGKQEATFNAITHAIGPIQAQLGRDLTGRFCPHLHFTRDDKMRKTLETLRLIDQAQQEYHEHPLVDESDEEDQSGQADETQL